MRRVRKEIRQLTDSEWDNVVNAMWIMKLTSFDEGTLKYGAHFVTYDMMVTKHAHAALNIRGDQAHFGPIFAVFHRAWLLQFENSLIAINSNISGIPFWNMYMDTSAALANQEPSIFSDKYVGSMVGEGDSYEVFNGRFANWKILHKDSELSTKLTPSSISTPLNAFGFLRHPLSLNAAPTLTRRGGAICGSTIAFPDSFGWFDCLDPLVSPGITEWDSCIEPWLHSPPHMVISGSWKVSAEQQDSHQCAQWFGVIPPPDAANSIVNSGTFISPYALHCFEPNPYCTGDFVGCRVQPVATHCGPLWTGIIEEMQTNTSAGQNRVTASNCDSEGETAAASHCQFMTKLADPSQIQILGDFGDPVASPNDPIFPFHHANVDRHFQRWVHRQLRQASNATFTASVRSLNHLGFPTSGYAVGCNLEDVISDSDPFQVAILQLLLADKPDTAQNTLLTVKMVLELTFGKYLPYKYTTSKAPPIVAEAAAIQSLSNLRSHSKHTANIFVLCMFWMFVILIFCFVRIKLTN